MAIQDNYWDDTRKLWIDGATGNYMRPVDQGGDDTWYSPDGRQRFVNGQWKPITATSVATARGFGAQSGFGFDILESVQAQETYIQNLNNQLNRDLANINNTAAAAIQAQQTALARELQAGRIDADKYIQGRELAQRESEFARQLAFQTRVQGFNEEIGKAQTELARLREVRDERELQSRLAANPLDFVAYEFYKRMLGQPQAWDIAQRMAGGAVPTGKGSELLGTTGQEPNLLGQPFEEAPPAYSDQTIQQIAESLFEPGKQSLYNPRLSGTGAFGVNISPPQDLSRQEATGLSDAELGILTSFLRAGVETTPGGKRIALDPQEYFKQVEQSWIPTLASVDTPTLYK